MRCFALRTAAALLCAALLATGQIAWAHGGGGGGGHGGGGFGGGGFGGGHGGGFGGGHMGGFGGGHMGGFGGFSGGHHGGFGGAPMGGFSGGHHSGFSGSSIGGAHHSGGISTFGGSSIGGHHLGGSTLNGGAIHHNPNSFTNRHAGGLTTGVGHHAATVTQGFRGTNLTTHAGGLNAQSLLGHQAGGLGTGHSAFLQHHGVTGTNLGGVHHGTGLTNNGLTNNLGAGSLHHGQNWNGQNMHHHHHGGNFFPFFGFYPFGLYGFGYPYYGFGYGYPYYRYGYGYPYYGYGYGSYGYNPYAYYGSYATTQPAAPAAPAATTAAGDARVFAEKGENDFKAGRYQDAVYAWKHASVDDPQNGVLLMMLAQAFFATGQYDQAAGATQAAMQLLPEAQWNVVVKNFRELYGRPADYTTQLRALEKEVKTNGDKPATRFLLAFHYGYLGYPSHAVKQLDKVLKLAPDDQMAKKLHEIMSNPKPEDQKPGDAKDSGDAKDPGDKSAKESDAPDKAAASKDAVDT